MHHLYQSTPINHLPKQSPNPHPLKIPIHIAKLCFDIQHNAGSAIIQIVEKHLSKQNKHKKSKNNNKKPHNFKPRFRPIEHPPISPPYTGPKTDTTTTTTQHNPPILKTTATQCTHPTLKTTGTQYTLPTSQNNSSTHIKSHIFHYTNKTPIIHHNTHRSTPLDHHHPFKHSSPSPSSSPLVTPQTTAHLQYHIPSRPIHKTLTNTTHQPSSTSAPQAFHTHHQHKPTLMHHAKHNNQITKPSLTNTAQPPQHPYHMQTFHSLTRQLKTYPTDLWPSTYHICPYPNTISKRL